MTSKDHELDRLLSATAKVIGWDQPVARERLLEILNEPCDDKNCVTCYPPQEQPMTITVTPFDRLCMFLSNPYLVIGTLAGLAIAVVVGSFFVSLVVGG